MKKPAAAEDAPLPKGTEAKKRPSGSPSEEGLEPLRKKASLAKGAGLTDEKLQALKEMSLKEKVAAIAAENPEDVEAATEALGQVVTPAEKQGLWQKHKTYLNNNPSEKGEHEQLSKKEKGEAILSWFLRKSPTYAVEKHSREAKSTLERKDKWLSQKQVDGKWTEAEQGMLIESGRLIWREDPTTPGLYEYKDTQDFVGRHSVSDRSSWERVKEEQLADEKSWEDALGKDLGAFLRKVSLSKGLVDPKTSKTVQVDATVFLPHVLFSSLDDYDMFPDLFSLANLEKFWSLAEKTGDDRLKQHPLLKGPGWKEKTVPLFVHGDAAEFQSRDSLMIWSFGSLLCGLSSLLSHFMLACFPKSCSTAGTWDAIMKWVAWSFEALGKGQHPTHDPEGNPLKKGSPFFESRGQPLTNGGYKGVIWSIQGDQEFFSNTLGLPHWRNASPCWLCDAKLSTDKPEKSVKTLDICKQDYCFTTNRQAMESPRSKHPLFGLPGCSSHMVRGDALHILFCKGVYSHFLGSVLHYLCWYPSLAKGKASGKGKGTACKSPAERLALIFELIQAKYKALGSPTRLTNLKLSMFVDKQKPHQSPPFLEIKGAEGKHLLPALAKVCQEGLLDEKIPCEREMSRALRAMDKLVQLWDMSDMFLSHNDFVKNLEFASEFLQAYEALSQWAQEHEKLLFHTVMKHHMLMHLARGAKHLNPRSHWCFKSEDFVGRVAALTHSVSMGVKSTNLCKKVAPKYRILLHMLLTREGFDQMQRQVQPVQDD
ncbi:ANK3 [Symbiodinium natans]|uniref:ANK3 protein n=1 Tax=Symbiodinium natans TaxID=878477 RepID=A0A812I6J1_9DINO|nr:ANK3 [Symbiodinium natans]